MKRIRHWLVRIGFVLLAIVIVLAGAGTWFVRRPWPKVEGTMAVSGLSAPVEVIRDPWGVPHIYAQNEHDLFFAQGCVHAQDRLWQMEMNRRAGSGTLSEVMGEVTLNTDRYLRTIGLRRAAERFWVEMDGEHRAILEAYAEGVNAYIETHRDRLPLEFTILGVDPKPWTPVDTLTWGNMMALLLCSNYRSELVRMQIVAELGEEGTQQLFSLFARDMPLIIPDPVNQYDWSKGLRLESLADVDEWLGNPTTLGRGSNSWAVHGSRTVTGMPILANDMHLDVGMPSVWYENGLHGGRFDSVGFTFPGVPLIIIGHNEHIAWGATNLGPDVMDLYLEKLDNPENPMQYEFMGEWDDLKIIQETIGVKGQEPVVLDILFTRHGPILNNALGILEKEPIALRWTLHEGNRLFQAVVQVNLATNWQEFHEALRYWEAPGQNLVYADVDGNIGYHASGKVPIRASGHQGTLPVPGWTGEYEWQDFIPFDELPSTLNPPAGLVVTANNKVVSDDYPHLLTYEWFPGYRAGRITDLLAASDQLTIKDIRNIQADTYSLPAEALCSYLLAVEPESDLQAQALTQVKAWDLNFEIDRVGASIYQTWYLFMLRNTIGDELGEELEETYLAGEYEQYSTQHVPMMIELMADTDNAWFDDVNTSEVETRDDIARRSLADAVNWLSERYGKNPDRWAWGQLHTVTFRHSPLGYSGIAPLERIFNSKTIPARGGMFSVNSAGFNWTWPFEMLAGTSQRMIVDLSNLDSSLAINNTGQSEQAFHPHREDLIPMWQNVEYKPMLSSREAVEAQSEALLTLTPQ